MPNMDEDSIVHEIVKGLAFEIEAVNQDNALKWTTTNGTPLNVKVRVRNKDEPRLVQRGPIPVPRIGITAPEKLRLISSDQTILSFNVYLEDDLVKHEQTKRSRGFKFFSIGGCLGTYSDDEGPYLPGSSKQNALGSKSSSKSDSGILNEKVVQNMGASNTLPQKQKGFFGKCKRGGCLDPPFGEDKYPYGLPKTNRQDNLELEIDELEENKQTHKPGGCLDALFNEDKYPYAPEQPTHREKNTLDAHEENKLTYSISVTSIHSSDKGNKESSKLKTFVQKTIKDEIDPKRLMDIYARTSKENSLTSKYSNSIITYPTDVSSTETLYNHFPKKRKSVKSYDEECQRQSYDYPQSYFVPPKNVLRYKEEERKYSTELSDDHIRKSSKNVMSGTTDNLSMNKTEFKSISQNAKGSKDKDEVKLMLTKLQPSDIDALKKLSGEKQKGNAALPHLSADVNTDTTKTNHTKNLAINKLLSDSRNSSRNIESDVKCLENTINPMNTGANRLLPIDSHKSSPDSVFTAHKEDAISAIEYEDNTSPEFHQKVVYNNTFPQDNSNVYNSNKQINATSDLQSQTEVYPGQTTDTDTIKNEHQASSPSHTLNKLDEAKAKNVVLKDNSLSSQLCQKEVSKENVESSKQSPLLPEKLITYTSDNQPSKIIQLNKPDVVDANTTTISMPGKPTLKSADKVTILKRERKDDIATVNEIHPERKQKEQRNLAPNISSEKNKEFAISSLHSIESKQEHLFNHCTNNQVDTMPRKVQDANLNVAHVNSVIIQNDHIRDKNIKITPEPPHKITNEILQKTPFITRHVSDIHSDEAIKTVPLKRNTFTIIGSDTSLLKQEDEEIIENIPDMFIKSIDDKIVNPNDKILTLSGVESSLNNVQKNHNDNQFKINNTPISIDQSHYILDQRDKQKENKLNPDIFTGHPFQKVKDTSTSSNQIEVLANQIRENRVYPEEFSSQIPMVMDARDLNSRISDIGKSVFTVQDPGKTTHMDVSNQKLEVKKYEDAHIDSSHSSIAKHVKGSNLSDDGKLVKRDQYDGQEAVLDTNKEVVSKIAISNSKLGELFPMTTKDTNSKMFNQSNEISESTATDISQKPNSEKTWNFDTKITDDVKSTLYTQARDEVEYLGPRKKIETSMHRVSIVDTSQKHKQEYLKDLDINDKDHYSEIAHETKSLLNVLNRDDSNEKLFTIDQKLENIISIKIASTDYTPILVKPIASNILPVNLISDEEGILELQDGSRLDTSQKIAQENVTNLYPEILNNSRYDLATHKHPKPEIINTENKELERRTNNNLNINSTHKLVPNKNTNELFFDSSHDSQTSNGIGDRDRTYQQLENKVYINSSAHGPLTLTSNNEQILDQNMTVIDSSPKLILDNINDKDILPEIDNDGKYVVSDKTDKLQNESSIDSSLDVFLASGHMNNISNEPKHEKHKTAHVHDSSSSERQKSITLEPLLYTDTETTTSYEKQVQIRDPVEVYDIAYGSNESVEKGGIVNEGLSNILENFEQEKKNPVRYDEHKYSGIKVIVPQEHTEITKSYETLDSKPADIVNDSGSTVITISIGDSDLDTKISQDSYNVPRNTLINISISTSNIVTDKDTNTKTITKALESMKYMSQSLDQVPQQTDDLSDTIAIGIDGAQFNYIVNVVEHKEDKLYEISIPENDLIEPDKDNVRKNSLLSISYNKAFVIYKEPALTTQIKINSTSQLDRENHAQTYVTEANPVRTESDSMKKDKSPLYLDLSFYSYINDKNQRIIQTRNPLIEQQQHDDGTVTVIKTLIRHGNQIIVPVDTENDIAFNILDKVNARNMVAAVGSPAKHIRREKNEVNRISKSNAVLNKNLALLYESELIPLHDAIRDLTQQVNTLTAKREILEEKKRNVKRAKSLRLIPVKRCGCRRM